MEKFRFKSGLGLSFLLLFICNVCLVIIAVVTGNQLLIACGILLSCYQYFLHRQFSKKRRILENELHGMNLKYILGFIPVGLSRLKNDRVNGLLNQKQQEVVAKRSKNVQIEMVRDNLLDPQESGFEYLQTKGSYVDVEESEFYVEVGTEQCSQPYRLSSLNFGMPQVKKLGKRDIHAISQAANMLGCAVNTGGEALSSDVIRGGADLIWQIRYDDCSLRNDDRSWNEELIKKMALRPYIKMIDVKFRHDNFSSVNKGLTAFAVFSFIKILRKLSNGKPVGIHLFNPEKEILNHWGKAMDSAGIHLDFIVIENLMIDQPLLRNSDRYKHRFYEAILASKCVINQYNLRTRVIASGTIVTEYDILRVAAMGADACFTAADTLVANGSIWERLGFLFYSQSIRIANFQRNTLNATRMLMRHCNYGTLSDSNSADFFKKLNRLQTRSIKEIYDQKAARSTYAEYTNLN